MEEFFELFSTEWVTVIIAGCAIIAVFLPEPKKDGIYKTIHSLINNIAFNFGKARNKDEIKKIR